MPKTPPKRWMDSCMRQVGKDSSITDPGAVCGNLWHNKMSASAKAKAMAKSEALWEEPYDEKGLAEALKECIAEIQLGKPEAEYDGVKDLMGKTKDTLNAIATWWKNAQESWKDRTVDSEKAMWAHLIKDIKDEMKVSAESLLFMGLPTSLVVETLDEEEPVAAAPAPAAKPAPAAAPAPAAKPQAAKTLTYKTLYLTKADGSKQTVPMADVIKAVTPYSKNFDSPMAAIAMGDPQQVLQVFQHVYGKDVAQWAIPPEESLSLQNLKALAIVELYNISKHKIVSKMFTEGEDKKLTIATDFIVALSDAFTKSDADYLTNLFPNSNPDYLKALIQEMKSALDELGTEQVNKLFPNINPEYLKNLKESEVQELVARLEEMNGKFRGRKRVKVKSEVNKRATKSARA